MDNRRYHGGKGKDLMAFIGEFFAIHLWTNLWILCITFSRKKYFSIFCQPLSGKNPFCLPVLTAISPNRQNSPVNLHRASLWTLQGRMGRTGRFISAQVSIYTAGKPSHPQVRRKAREPANGIALIIPGTKQMARTARASKATSCKQQFFFTGI